MLQNFRYMHISSVNNVRISHAKKKPWEFRSGCNLQQKRINLNCMSNIYFPSHYMFDKIGYDTSSLPFLYLAETTQKRRLHPLAQYTKSTTQRNTTSSICLYLSLQSLSLSDFSQRNSKLLHLYVPLDNWHQRKMCLITIQTKSQSALK